MVIVAFDASFEKTLKKIKDSTVINKVKNQIKKIIENPEIGKTMRYNRKGTREVYISPFRLSYAYIIEENKIIFLDIYHKDEQ
jgi:mRNA-degrading endonuclease RelE of RelBE toxin-antitoxin system